MYLPCSGVCSGVYGVYMGCLYRAFRGVLEVYMVYIHVYRVYIGVIMVMQVYTRVNKEYII